MRIPDEWLRKADQLHLAMHLSNEALSVGLFDVASKQPLWMQRMYGSNWEWIEKIQSWRWTEPLFRKVTLTHSPQQWTLCPPHLFSPDHLSDWFTTADKGTLAYHHIEGQEIVLIEQMHSISAPIIALFANGKEFSIVDHWLHFHLSPSSASDQLILIVEDGVIGVLLQKKGQLQLANQFSGHQMEDVLYFASAVLQQHQCSQDTDILLCGQQANAELLHFFEPYFTSVKCWEAPFGLKMPKGHDAAIWHNLLLHTLCAS